MRALRRLVALAALALLAGIAITVAQPSPEQARANALCDVGTAPIGAVAGAVGIGNPVSDVCSAVTDPILGVAGKVLDPLKEAAAAVGKGVFSQITAWVADGAVWLLGEIGEAADESTSPNLLGKGFLHQYRLMVGIAAAMAALMLILAVFEALGRGDGGMLWRVFLVNLPLAAIATSVAYVVVQLLLAVDDGMCRAITQSTGRDAHHFLKGTVEALAALGGGYGGAVGSSPGAAAGSVEVPLFVGFIAAVVAAFAAFFVWIELLMRDAAVYVVALFMPLALAASVWPRWASALRRTCELVIVIVFSKFVIVAVISLAASMLSRSEGSAEQVLAAAAMLLLACFASAMLMKLVPFAETAVAAAYSRQSAASGAVRSLELANSATLMRRMSRSNWAAGGGGGSGSGGGALGARPSKGPSAGGSADAKGGGSAAGGEAAAAGPAAAGAVAVAAAVGAAKAAKSGGERLGRSAEAGTAADAGERPGAGASPAPGGGGGPVAGPRGAAAGGEPPRGAQEEAGGGRAPLSGSTPTPAAGGGDGQAEGQRRPAPEPREAPGGGGERPGSRPPRPSAGNGPAEAKGGGT